MTLVGTKGRRLLLWLVLLPASAWSADPVRGQELYQRFCQTCHGTDGADRLRGGVDFSRGEGLFRTDRALKRRIEAGKGGCPAFRGLIRSEEINHVIAYLRTFQ